MVSAELLERLSLMLIKLQGNICGESFLTRLGNSNSLAASTKTSENWATRHFSRLALVGHVNISVQDHSLMLLAEEALFQYRMFPDLVKVCPRGLGRPSCCLNQKLLRLLSGTRLGSATKTPNVLKGHRILQEFRPGKFLTLNSSHRTAIT
jgi:hypothetical protein